MSATTGYRRPHCSDRLRWRDLIPTDRDDGGRVRPKVRMRAAARQPVAPAPIGRYLTPDQVSAIAGIMRLFVKDDLANGVSPARRLVCDACQQACPAPGFIRYEQWQLCNPCATQYEIRRARGLVHSIGAYLTEIQARRAN